MWYMINWSILGENLVIKYVQTNNRTKKNPRISRLNSADETFCCHAFLKYVKIFTYITSMAIPLIQCVQDKLDQHALSFR